MFLKCLFRLGLVESELAQQLRGAGDLRRQALFKFVSQTLDRSDVPCSSRGRPAGGSAIPVNSGIRLAVSSLHFVPRAAASPRRANSCDAVWMICAIPSLRVSNCSRDRCNWEIVAWPLASSLLIDARSVPKRAFRLSSDLRERAADHANSVL